MSLETGATYTIQNYGSGKMLNIYNAGSVVSGTNVVQWSADGSTEQKWVLQSGSSSGTYNLCSKFNTDLVLDAYAPMRPIPSGANADIWRDDDPQAQNLKITELSNGNYKIALSSSPSLVLTARGTANGSANGKSSTSDGNVFWSTYSSSNLNQQWILEEVSNNDRHAPPVAGLYNLVNSNGINLNVYAGQDQNGTALVMWTEDGSIEQQFVLSNLNGRSKLFARCSSNGSNRVVDAYRPSGAVQSGAKAQIWENTDPVSQELVVTPVGDNYYKISLKSDNSLAITAGGASDNSAVTFSNYTGLAAQKWQFRKIDPNANGALDTHNPPSSGIYNIVSSNGAYLNVYGGRDANLTKIVMWAGDGSVDQQFRLGSYGEGSKLYAMCSSGGNSRVLDAYRPSGAVANGAKAQLYDSNDDISQTLTITPKGDGFYKIALNSNKTLALTASGSANNSNVTYSFYTGAPGQLWRLNQVIPIDISTHEPPSEGVYNLINSNGAYLNVYAGIDADGTKAVMWTGDGSIEQKFRLSNGIGFSRFYAMCSFNGAGRVLDAYKPGQYVLNGTTAEIWNPTDDTAQLLCISKVGTKYKVALQSNTSLALTASDSDNNSAVTYTTYTGALNQLWTLQRVSDWNGEPVPSSFSIEYNHTDNCYPSRFGLKPLAWVCHIADGTLSGTVAWFKNPESEVSSNYVIGRDGRIIEMVPVNKAAWANGTNDDSSSRAWWGNSTSALVLKNKSNANYYTISIEFEGYWNVTKGKMSQAQIKAAAWLMRYVRRVYNIDIPLDRDHILGHYQINPISRPNCPGAEFQFEELIAEIGVPTIPETGGGDPISYQNMYFIKHAGDDGAKYLTVDTGITSTQRVVNPDVEGNTVKLEPEKLPHDHSLNKFNIRQLFKIYYGVGEIKPVCSDLGTFKYALGMDENDGLLKLLEDDRDGGYYNITIEQVVDSNAYKIFTTYKADPGKEYRLTVENGEVKFTNQIDSNSPITQKWQLEEAFGNDDEAVDYYRPNEVYYSNYNVVDDTAVNNDPQYKDPINSWIIKVTGMPDIDDYNRGYERFHPYSGMQSVFLNSTYNYFSKQNESVYRPIEDIVQEFYTYVFGIAPQKYEQYMYNLYGAYTDPHGFHAGVDMFTDQPDQSIISAQGGEITYIDKRIDGFGTVSIFNEEYNVTFIYAHMKNINSELTAKNYATGTPGTIINKGEDLGIMSDVGAPGNIHLHFEVQAKEQHVGMNPYLTKEQWGVLPMNSKGRVNLAPYPYMCIL